ncbi:hypothetical protein KY308_02615, partial [Candidatus Woesearchaeota archaeon]|nr:hypothetical protein [Candidatus Woesearchaeota archaeon]
SKQISKIQDIIKSQKKALADIEAQHSEARRAGELIYENYGEIDKAISAIKQKNKPEGKKVISVENSKLVMDL